MCFSESKTKNRINEALCGSWIDKILMGWLMGFEPTTTGITILDSTN